MRFSVVALPEPDGGFSITVPQLPGCNSAADTLDEAVVMARDAIAVHLRGLEAVGEELPEEIDPAVLLFVDVDVATLGKAKPHAAGMPS